MSSRLNGWLEGLGLESWRWDGLGSQSVSELLSGEESENKIQGPSQKLREFAVLPSTPRAPAASKVAWDEDQEEEESSSETRDQRQAQGCERMRDGVALPQGTSVCV